MNELTAVLRRSEGGEPAAAGELLALVYDELRKLAARKLAREAPGQTLQATALVQAKPVIFSRHQHRPDVASAASEATSACWLVKVSGNSWVTPRAGMAQSPHSASGWRTAVISWSPGREERTVGKD